jgi:uncharacterized membrane-anchored protein YhcB (DUF1043 family)
VNNKKIRVFLSRPNPFTKEQQYFIEKLKSTLDKYNIESIKLQYNKVTSLVKIILSSYLRVNQLLRENYQSLAEIHLSQS